jgi:hypothetical protein
MMESIAVEKRSAAEGQDSFSISYFLWIMSVWLLFASGNDLDRIFNLWLALVPLLFLPAFVVAICCVIALVRNLRLGRWRRVASVLAAPIAAYIVFAGARAAGIDSEWIRFEIGKRYYIDQIAQLPHTGEPRLKMFDWGQTGGAGVPNFIYTLIYDESDEISRSAEGRSKEWKDRASRLCAGTTMCPLLEAPPNMSTTVKNLEGHFYSLTEAW